MAIVLGERRLEVCLSILDHPDIDPNFVAIDGRTALIQAIDPDVANSF